MHENVGKFIECDIGKKDWVEGASINFSKRNYILKFITIQFDSGAAGDVDIKIENEQGRLIPWQASGGDDFVRAVSEQPLKFYLGAGLGTKDTFKIFYRNRSSGSLHYVNVFFEFVRGGKP